MADEDYRTRLPVYINSATVIKVIEGYLAEVKEEISQHDKAVDEKINQLTETVNQIKSLVDDKIEVFNSKEKGINDLIEKLNEIMATLTINNSACTPSDSISPSYTPTYYVSSSGSDLNDGLTSSTPWKTLSKVGSETFSPSDIIAFKCGEYFEGTLIAPSSGTSGFPITFGAYGTGLRPKIYGSEIVTGWTLYSGNIWKATVSQDILQLFADGDRLPISRYPKTYADISTVNTTTEFVSTDITSQPADYYKDLKCVLKTERYNMVTKTVTASSGQTITIDSIPTGGLEVGRGFFFINKLDFLTQAGEWYYDSSTKTVYAWMTGSDDPSNYEIRASIHNYGISATNKDYVTIRDIQFEQQAEDSIYGNSCDYLTIQDCKFYNAALKGIQTLNTSTGLNIERNYMTGTMDSNMYIVSSTNSTILDNELHNCGQLANISLNTGFSTSPGQNIYTNYCNNTTIQYNKIYNSGYVAIKFNNGIYFINRNFSDGSCQTFDDGGAIYTYTGSNYLTTGVAGSTVSENIVLNSWGTPDGVNNITSYGYGIYFDHHTHDVTVEKNIISGAVGGFLHGANYNINNNNNIIYNCNVHLLATVETLVGNLSIHDNTICTTDRNGTYLGWYNSFQRITKITTPANIDFYNNTYISHYATNDVFYGYTDFASWQAVAGSCDTGSTFDNSTLPVGNDEELFYNNTKIAKTFNINGATAYDIDGNQVTVSFTLQPFEGKILTGTDLNLIS